MSKFDWKGTLGKVAPALATALGGPMAGVAVGMAAQALGLTEGATEDDLAVAVASGNPDTLLKLRQCDADFKLKMKELGVKLEEINASDRASARDMAAKTGIQPQVVLATIYVLGFVLLLVALFSGQIEIADSMREPAMILLGALIAGNEQIRNFFFGSSSSSKEKSKTIATLKGDAGN